MADVAVEGNPFEPALAFAKSNPAVAIALTSASVAVLEILSVSGFNTDTALSIIAFNGLSGLITGFVVIFTPIVGFLAAVILVPIAVQRAVQHQRRGTLEVAAVGSTVATALLAPLLLLGGLLALMALWGVDYVWKIRRHRPPKPPRLADVWPFAVVVALFIVATGRPWVPLESINWEASDGSSGGAFGGYVMGTQGTFTGVLTGSRSMMLIRSDYITDRKICPSSKTNAFGMQFGFAATTLTDLLLSNGYYDCSS